VSGVLEVVPSSHLQQQPEADAANLLLRRLLQHGPAKSDDLHLRQLRTTLLAESGQRTTTADVLLPVLCVVPDQGQEEPQPAADLLDQHTRRLP
jgi:hypothetical protein